MVELRGCEHCLAPTAQAVTGHHCWLRALAPRLPVAKHAGGTWGLPLQGLFEWALREAVLRGKAWGGSPLPTCPTLPTSAGPSHVASPFPRGPKNSCLES